MHRNRNRIVTAEKSQPIFQKESLRTVWPRKRIADFDRKSSPGDGALRLRTINDMCKPLPICYACLVVAARSLFGVLGYVQLGKEAISLIFFLPVLPFQAFLPPPLSLLRIPAMILSNSCFSEGKLLMYQFYKLSGYPDLQLRTTRLCHTCSVAGTSKCKHWSPTCTHFFQSFRGRHLSGCHMKGIKHCAHAGSGERGHLERGKHNLTTSVKVTDTSLRDVVTTSAQEPVSWPFTLH